MTEQEWLRATEPRPMLELIKVRASDRKLRLFACICVRESHRRLPAPDTPTALHIVEIQELYADGRRNADTLAALGKVDYWVQAQGMSYPAAYRTANRYWIKHPDARLLAEWAAAVDGEDWDDIQPEDVCHFLRELFGNPFRPPPPTASSVLQWNQGLVRRLAEQADEHRLLPSGHLDLDRLAVLADALEEAGADAELAEHLRGPGPHVRGCWVVDQLTDRK